MLETHVHCDIRVVHIHFLFDGVDDFLTVLATADNVDHAVPFWVDGRQGMLEHVLTLIITVLIVIVIAVVLLCSQVQLPKAQLVELFALVIVEIGPAAESTREDDDPHYNSIG